MKEENYFVLVLEEELETGDQEFVVNISRKEYNCIGNEEFSLNEEEVDKILGDEAFCGGDLSDELLAKLEKEACKKFKFYFSSKYARDDAENFEAFLIESGATKIHIEEIKKEDWNETWKQFYKPLNIGNFVILPVWESDKKIDKGMSKIIINPGMGFGTGTHETTKQCLLALQDQIEAGQVFKNCLDFGAGSGILGLAFQKLFNGEIDYVDIDDRALSNNKDNFNLNFPLSKKRPHFILRSDFRAQKKYDLVFANILEHVLIEELDLITACVKAKKILIISGLLFDQKMNILNKYKKNFNLLGEKRDGDWLALTFQKI